MKHGIADTLLLVGCLLLAIASLMLVSNSHAAAPNTGSKVCIVNNACSPNEACVIQATGIVFRIDTH